MLTFMFNHLRGNPHTVLKQMQDEVTLVYTTLLTRVFRRPNAAKNVDSLPRWLVVPDYPIFKHEKQDIRDVSVNNGLHMHAIAAQPASSRLRVPLNWHFREHSDLYIRHGQPLRFIHAEIIASDPAYVVAYAMKGIQRDRVAYEDMMILPRSPSELGRPSRLR